jgi:hypothetical protein
MDYTQTRASSAISILITAVLILAGFVALYYLYKFVYGTLAISATPISTGQKAAMTAPTNLPAAPAIYEGGDYSVSMWIYVNSYNVNRNSRKHLFELVGDTFSTLLIGLGAFKNSLLVRTHSRDLGSSTYTSTDACGNKVTTSKPAGTQTPASEEAMRQDGSLTKQDLSTFFQPLAVDDSIIDSSPMCDLPEIDMQRWVLVTVVLSGRIVDVYLDGKLSRSCITRSYFKVDPTGVKIKMLQNGGFDGQIGNTMAYNYALTPSDVYRIYQNGPTGTSTDVMNWFVSLFKSRN